MTNVNQSSDLDSISITLAGYEDYDDNIYVSSSSDTITLSDFTSANLTIGGSSNAYPWTGTSAVPWTTGTGIHAGNWGSNHASGKIRLDGPEADIEINGESLIDMLKNIEQRLNILKPNTSLEKEWDELRALGEQYRALEKQIQEKMATWDKLKAMPPPEID